MSLSSNLLITDSVPQQDGFFMPAEFAPIKKVWIIWPYRADNWRQNAAPAKAAYADVARAIRKFCDVGVLVSPTDYLACRARLPADIEVIAMPSNDAWARDIVPTFLLNDKGELRACDRTFNAWGGDYEIEQSDDAKARHAGDVCIASYANFLICNDAIIVPQYDDVHDSLAITQLEKIFPQHQVVGVRTKEIVYGGGNIHCITQQQPKCLA